MDFRILCGFSNGDNATLQRRAADFTARSHRSGCTPQRRGRGVLIEPRRVRAIWWRKNATALPMRVFPKETFRAPRREPEGTSVPSARSFGSFSAAGQKMNINSLTSARCARLSVGELRSFCLLMPIRPQRGRVRVFFITFFACAKKVTQESTPRNLRFLWLFP